MRIKQSYHGNGSKEGYLYQLLQADGQIEEIEFLSTDVNIGSVLQIEEKLFEVTHVYDCKESLEEDEVVWFEIQPYAFVPDFVLSLKK